MRYWNKKQASARILPIFCCRFYGRMNIPSRYVSGYICPHRSGLRGEGATHAWVEAWIPGSGWTGIDPNQ